MSYAGHGRGHGQGREPGWSSGDHALGPGKRTLTMALPVQLKPGADAAASDPVSAPTGGSRALPDDLQAKMGRSFDAASTSRGPDPHAGALGNVPGKGPQQAVGATAHTLDRGLLEGRQALQLIGLVRSMLFPAYRRAVDALDPGPALELARHVVGSVQVAEAGKQEVHTCLPVDDPHRYQMSLPGQADLSEAEIAQRYNELVATRTQLDTDLTQLENELAVQIGPQMFRGQPVLGSYTQPTLGTQPTAYLSNEAAIAVELISTVVQIRVTARATGASCPMLDADQRTTIAGMVEPWRSRPVNFAFLVKVLREEGIWDALAQVRGQTGATLEQTNQDTIEQAKQTGALADVGELDTTTLTGILGIDRTDPALLDHGPPAIDDDAAMKVFEKLRTAAPEARGPLIRQIDQLRELGELCDHLPWQYVKAIHDAVVTSDPHAAAMLRPYFEGKGGGHSMHQIYMDEVDDQLSKDHTVRAFGWFFLDFLHNALTGGFEHEYSEAYDAHEQGWTTDDQFHSQATKALGKAAAIIVGSAVIGGVVGEVAEGASAGLGASRSVAQIIGGGAGGFAAGVGGHLTGDVYDQMLNGKQGFDSFGDYIRSGAMGGAIGTVLAGVSVAGGKYLPASGQRTVDTYAARFPRIKPVLENIRASGFRSGSAVRMKVADLIEMLGSGFGGPGGPNAFADTGIGDIRALPLDTEISVRMRPLRPLTQPMQMSSINNNGDDNGKKAIGDPTTTSTEPTAPKLNEGPVVSIEDVEVISMDPSRRAPQVEGTRLDPAEWVARLKAMMTANEVAQFEAMRRGSDAEVQARYKGDFDAARQHVKNALAGKQGKAAFERASQSRAAELRAKAEARGLLTDPEVAKILDRLGEHPGNEAMEVAIRDLRSRLISDIIGDEIALAYPGKEVLRDVKISEQRPGGSIEDYMKHHTQADGKTSARGLREIETAGGKRVYLDRTDIDVMVVERGPDGRLRIVHREEIKSGHGDQATGSAKRPGAKEQLGTGKQLLSDAAQGKTKIRMELGGVDITDQFDLSSVDSSTGATRGPAGKTGFDQSLGATAADLKAMIEELIQDQLKLRAGGKHE